MIDISNLPKDFFDLLHKIINGTVTEKNGAADELNKLDSDIWPKQARKIVGAKPALRQVTTRPGNVRIITK